MKVLLEARLAWHRVKAAFRRAKLERWQKTGATAHYWHDRHLREGKHQDAQRNQKQIEDARVQIRRWKGLLAPELLEIGRLIVALKKLTPPGNITMYDAIEPSQIPLNAEAVAGYVGGRWPDYNEEVKRFPSARHVSIAIASNEDAKCLDVETGDASPGDVVKWFRRQRILNVPFPMFYASISVWPQIEAELKRVGIKRSQYRKWGAHYTGIPHLEPDFDGIQYTDVALGRNLDASLCKPTFFD